MSNNLVWYLVGVQTEDGVTWCVWSETLSILTSLR